MNSQRLLTVLIVTLLVSAYPAAQEIATTEQVMRLHRQAIGGMDAVMGYITGLLEYSITASGDRTGTMRAIHGPGGAYREIRTFGEIRTAAVFSNGEAFIINTSTGKGRSQHSAAGYGLDLYYLNLYRSGALIFPLFSAESLLGAEISVLAQGEMGYSLQARYADGTIRIFTLGSDLLIIRDVTRVSGEGAELTITREYSNYKSVDGAKLPGNTELRVEGEITRGRQVQKIDSGYTLTLQSAKGNTSPPERLFYVDGPAFIATGSQVNLGSLTFTYAGTVPVGDDPESILAADMDGDGAMDLITGDDGRGTVLFGDGRGAFLSGISLPAGGGSNEYILPLDWNGDGRLDLVAASTDGPPESLIPMIARGERTFEASDPIATGDFPEALASADFNGDGHVDLVAPHNRSGDIWIHFGDGRGGLIESKSYSLGGRGENLAVADYNNDGDIDVAVVDQKNLTVFLNDGSGNMTAGEPLQAGDFPFCVIAGDFDGDGNQDIVVGNGGIFRDVGPGDLAYFEGRGDGSFSAARMISAGASITALSVADFDADGDLDLVASSFGDHTAVVLENRDGELLLLGALPAGWSPAAVVAADINGDGLVDIAIANEHSDDVSLWLQQKQE